MIATTILFAAVAWKKLRIAWSWRFGFSAKCATVDRLYDEVILRDSRSQVEVQHLRERNAYLEQLFMQLRVYGMKDGPRTGFAVTAFIPSDVLAHLKDVPNAKRDLVWHVANVLVKRAMAGLWNMESANREVTALVFEPLGNSAQASTWVKDGQRPVHIAPMVDGPQTRELIGEKQRALYESRAAAGLVQCARPPLPK